MFNDFKKFIMRGNVLDLAVGVVIGAAFGKIVTSLVNDIITPLIGVVVGGVDLTGLHIRIGGTDLKPINLTYGNFIQAIVDFLIIGGAIFMFVRLMSRLQKQKEQALTPPSRQEELLSEIRDLLARR